MKITVHSLGMPVEIETDSIRAYLWNTEMCRVVLLLDQPRPNSHLPVDEELFELEQIFQDGGK